MPTLLNRIAEKVSSTWILLSDTTNFLSRVGLLERYEKELREWRADLARYKRQTSKVQVVRENVVALRRLLRTQGHDLRLGSKDIALEGWRHDDAVAEGFRRVVVGITENDVVSLAGEVNHIELAEALEQRLQAQRRNFACDMHFLWYRWRNQVLVLSGAASETAEQFERLKEYFAGHKELLLRKLAHL